MCFRSLLVTSVTTLCGMVLAFSPRAVGQEDSTTAEVRASSGQLVKAFNGAKPDEVVAQFLPQGELIDEEGVVHQGQKEIRELLTAYFAKFPAATLTHEIESIRLVGPVAIEEGSRKLTSRDKSAHVQLRYIAVRVKTPNGWRIASIRDFADDPAPTNHERLLPLAWLVGDWVNEGSDAVVKISYRWSEDKNYLLGDFLVTTNGSVTMKSSQRIGWDPLAGRVRSWLFDSDGGYGEGHWAQVDQEWVIKSSAVLPDGQTGSATLTMIPGGEGRYTLKSTDRIVGNMREDDFEVTVTKRPPVAGQPTNGK